MFTLLPFIDILSVPKKMIGKSTPLPNTPSKPNSEPSKMIQHREINSIKLSTNLDLEALAQCNREIRSLLIQKDTYSLQKFYKLLDKAFFDGQTAKLARIMQCKTEISDDAEIGRRLRCDGQGGIMICLPARGVKSAQEVITILLREMAAINFWQVDTCSCGECRCAKEGAKICDFVYYLSEINATVNFHLKGFQSRWRIVSGEYLILKDVVKVLQDAEKVDPGFPFTFKIPKPSPKDISLIQEPLETQGTVPEAISPVEEPLKAQDAATVSSPVEEPLETQDAATKVPSPVEEPLEKLDTAPEVTSQIEQHLETQDAAAKVSSPVKEPLGTQDATAEVYSPFEELLEKLDTALEVPSPIEEPLETQDTARKVISRVEARSRIPRFVMT